MSWLERLVDALRDGLTEEQWAAIESKVESERRKHAGLRRVQTRAGIAYVPAEVADEVFPSESLPERVERLGKKMEDHWYAEDPSVLSPADKQILKNLKEMAELWEEIRGEKPAAGPWKAWPENKPALESYRLGKRYLVQLSDRVEIARYLHGDEVFTTEGLLHLSGVTHFAELNTEGAK